MTSSAEIFTLILLSTAGLYVSMLAYFNGLVGTKRLNTPIMWNSEPIIWFITLLFMVSVVFRIVGPAGEEGPGVWFLIGAGNLLVVYTYLILKLARHDLPEKACWVIAALTVIAIIYALANIVLALFSETLNLALYAEELGLLFASMTHILLLVLLFLFIRSLGSSVMHIWTAASNAPWRLTAGGIKVTATGNVSNPDGAISDINPESGASTATEPCTLHPDASIIVDFGIRRLEDHGFRSDLRILRANEDQPITVEVSNDKHNWQACFRDDKILSDWDVPYYSNPWRYVRICNKGNQPIEIVEVYDLD